MKAKYKFYKGEKKNPNGDENEGLGELNLPFTFWYYEYFFEHRYKRNVSFEEFMFKEVIPKIADCDDELIKEVSNYFKSI